MTLIGWWPLTETSGDAQDYSSNNNTGTVVGATQGSTGPIGYNCYDFDGTDDTVTGGDSTIQPGTNDLTFTAWVNMDDMSTTRAIVGSIETGGDQSSYSLRLFNGGDLRFLIAEDNSTPGPRSYKTATSVASTNTWHHIAATFENSTGEITLFVDGADVGGSYGEQDSSFTVDTTNPIGIGHRAGDSVWHSDGGIFDVRWYDRQLSPQEIAYIYEVSEGASYTSNKRTL